jgi:hypothetical protein
MAVLSAVGALFGIALSRNVRRAGKTDIVRYETAVGE